MALRCSLATVLRSGKFYLELSPELTQTEIRVQEPKLIEATPELPSAEAAVEEPEATEQED